MKFRLLYKCLGIFLIIVLFSVALSMVEFKVYERQTYRNQATNTVANGWSESQLMVGPLLELSFQKDYKEKRFDKELKKYIEVDRTRRWSEYRLIDSLSIDSNLTMQERYVGIFKVPVYTADINLEAQHKGLKLNLPNNTRLLSTRLLISINDIRGLNNQPQLMWNGQVLPFEPGDQQKLLGNYLQTSISPSQLAGNADLKMQLSLRGVDRIGFVPSANNVKASLNANWPHPSFSGRYLPSDRSISEQGFDAKWGVNSFASSILKTLKDCTGEPQSCEHLLRENQFGVKLGSSVDVYQMTDRAIKYGFLFVLLTFVVFSLLELQKRFVIHPIQYGFVGASLAVFYLLLISLSEHLRFESAYLIAAVACSLLISTYLKVVLNSGRLALIFAAAFAGLYAMMFAILQSEDYAFLMGTLLIFSLLSAIMYSTRRIKWHELGIIKQTEIQEGQAF